MSILDDMKAKYTVLRPDSIREKLTAWAFEDADNIQQVIDSLESTDCAACVSPAPIYNDDMAKEIACHWTEIDLAIDDYRDAVGRAWAPESDQGVLSYLWFAYEWIAHEIASEIRSDLEFIQEAERAVPVPGVMDTPETMKHVPSITAAILANPDAFLPETGHANDNHRSNDNGREP